MDTAARPKIIILVAGIGALTAVLCFVGFRLDDIAAWYKARPVFEYIGRNKQGYREYRHQETEIVFVSLPAGTFLMGSPEGEESPEEDERPVHEVRLSPFMIAKYELTQAQWEKVMGVGSNPSDFTGENLPVDLVSWDDLHADRGFLKRTDFLLPTEAQWEYACRGGTPGRFSGTGILNDMGWYNENSSGKTHPVAGNGVSYGNWFG